MINTINYPNWVWMETKGPQKRNTFPSSINFHSFLKISSLFLWSFHLYLLSLQYVKAIFLKQYLMSIFYIHIITKPKKFTTLLQPLFFFFKKKHPSMESIIINNFSLRNPSAFTFVMGKTLLGVRDFFFFQF